MIISNRVVCVVAGRQNPELNHQVASLHIVFNSESKALGS